MKLQNIVAVTACLSGAVIAADHAQTHDVAPNANGEVADKHSPEMIEAKKAYDDIQDAKEAGLRTKDHPPINQQLLTEDAIKQLIEKLHSSPTIRDKYRQYYKGTKPHVPDWDQTDIKLSQVAGGDKQFAKRAICSNPQIEQSWKKEHKCGAPVGGRSTAAHGWKDIELLEHIFQVNDLALGMVSVVHSKETPEPIVVYQPHGAFPGHAATAFVDPKTVKVSFDEALSAAKRNGMKDFNSFALNNYGHAGRRETKPGQPYFNFLHEPWFTKAGLADDSIHVVGAKDACVGEKCLSPDDKKPEASK